MPAHVPEFAEEYRRIGLLDRDRADEDLYQLSSVEEKEEKGEYHEDQGEERCFRSP